MPGKTFLTTDGRGWGYKNTEDVKAGDLIIEYIGEVIDHDELISRLEMKKMDNFYFFQVDQDMCIDAGRMGNNARYLNHSCNANCLTQKWQVGSETRVGIFALKDIPANTELVCSFLLMFAVHLVLLVFLV